MQRLRVLQVDPVPDTTQTREFTQVLGCSRAADHIRDHAMWHRVRAVSFMPSEYGTALERHKHCRVSAPRCPGSAAPGDPDRHGWAKAVN
jgi:hypothetical protein